MNMMKVSKLNKLLKNWHKLALTGMLMVGVFGREVQVQALQSQAIELDRMQTHKEGPVGSKDLEDSEWIHLTDSSSEDMAGLEPWQQERLEAFFAQAQRLQQEGLWRQSMQALLLGPDHSESTYERITASLPGSVTQWGEKAGSRLWSMTTWMAYLGHPVMKAELSLLFSGYFGLDFLKAAERLGVWLYPGNGWGDFAGRANIMHDAVELLPGVSSYAAHYASSGLVGAMPKVYNYMTAQKGFAQHLDADQLKVIYGTMDSAQMQETFDQDEGFVKVGLTAQEKARVKDFYNQAQALQRDGLWKPAFLGLVLGQKHMHQTKEAFLAELMAGLKAQGAAHLIENSTRFEQACATIKEILGWVYFFAEPYACEGLSRILLPYVGVSSLQYGVWLAGKVLPCDQYPVLGRLAQWNTAGVIANNLHTIGNASAYGVIKGGTWVGQKIWDTASYYASSYKNTPVLGACEGPAQGELPVSVSAGSKTLMGGYEGPVSSASVDERTGVAENTKAQKATYRSSGSWFNPWSWGK